VDRLYRSVIRTGRVLLNRLDLSVRSAGTEHVPASGPVVLAANHVSFPDFVFVQEPLVGRRLVRFMCRADIWASPAGRLMSAMRHVPVDRAAPAAAYLTARRLLGEGEPVCVFPEAGISAAYVVRALMPGAVALAHETGAPLVPVSVWGGARLWPQKRALDAPFPPPQITRGARIDVRFHPPLEVTGDRVADTRRLGAVLQDGLEELQRLPEHQPRPGEWAPRHPAHLGGDAVEREASYALDGMPRSAVTPTWGPVTAST
jgi:1-acyl-sn-glycerol-3-phosphate acyltransferase